jgi:MoaA/NifB/PqqE/SkfB family radical SAM enzyme
MDFNQRPFTVVWETTRACALACVHCRAERILEEALESLPFEESG